MRQFLLERVYALDEDMLDLKKHTFLGVDKHGDWFVFDRMPEVQTDKGRLQYRRDMADGMILDAFDPTSPIEMFRDYWSFVCGEDSLSVPYFEAILVKAKKTQILGIMPELV